MSNANAILKRASRFSVASGARRSTEATANLLLLPGIGRTRVMDKDVYEEALRRAGKRLWKKKPRKSKAT